MSTMSSINKNKHSTLLVRNDIDLVSAAAVSRYLIDNALRNELDNNFKTFMVSS
ncbi:hypothetical protein [Proteus phage 10]|nr:hypothetical protein [Proteus phage 10]